MSEMIIEVMEQIEAECREEGYYPDLVELMEMAMVRLNGLD